ncbi:NUDIX hydrolase [Sagittula sp. NFXS13]|uniref:NUDIX hydrolase n=1 Tax=Sagittula sp. NFXS13 TaxID=2819095 RepID=UPI0032DFF892
MIDWPGAPRARFRGAKLMLFAGDDVLVLRRDDVSWIDWPGYLDFPGGLRDPGETPEACVLRETREELGLDVSSALLRPVHLHHGPKGVEWFFAAHGSEDLIDQARFGDEGQGWKAMRPKDFVAAEDAIPQFRTVLAAYLKTL